MRKHVLSVFFVLGLLLAYWIRPVPAQACTTTPEGQPAPTLQDRIDHASLIFTGTVVAMEGEMYEEVAVIAVSHYFKGGDGASQVKVGSWGDGAVCRRMVAVGESWLFYVMDYGNGTLHADCAVAPPNPDFLASITELTAALPVTQPAETDPTAETTETTPAAAQPDESSESSSHTVTEIPAPPPIEPPRAVPLPDDRPAQLPPSSFGFLPMMVVVLGLLCAVVLGTLVVGVFLLRRNQGKVS
jgi:hypothetical protein